MQKSMKLFVPLHIMDYKKVKPKKELTKQQVLVKLTALCARSEHCQQEMVEKMRRWEVSEQMQAEVMEYLVAEKYIDDERFARFFINDKVKFNKWGRRKVEMALRMKGIDEKVYAPLLSEMDDTANYEETLTSLLRTKRKSVTGRNDYEVRMKLIRFALSRGFTMDVIEKALDAIE